MKNRALVTILSSILALGSCITNTQPTKSYLDIIPMPNKMSIGITQHKIALLECDDTDTTLLNLVGNFTNRIHLPIDGNGLVLTVAISDTIPTAESYHLVVDEKRARITASDYAGAFYGLNTLEQLIEKSQVNSIDIYDSPNFPWRGFMIDVTRHFFDKEKIFELIDILAYHRINKLHLHLTDGIGWRIEIDKYPLLTQKGAWRIDDRPEAPWASLNLSTEDNPLATGGFYTKADLTEIIAYANTQHIEVIPEIEMPGHSNTVLECYPEYRCTSGKNNGVFCIGKEATYSFLFDILTEIIAVSPSEYIHIGADEVPMEHWEKCSDCRKLMKKHKLKNTRELYGYFINRVAEFLETYNKKLIGWDEITANELPENVAVMSWTGWEGGLKAAKQGHKTIMCPLDYVYFDHYQSNSTKEPQAWGGKNTLSRVYDFPVIPINTPDSIAKNIIGGQANLWTENISQWSHFQYMLLPRLAALSESLWTKPENKNWYNFQQRINKQLSRYKEFNWNYSNSSLAPVLVDQKFDRRGNLRLTFSSEITENVTLRYTTDRTEPLMTRKKYDSTLTISTPSNLIVSSFLHDTILIETIEIPRLLNKATRKDVMYYIMFNDQYSAGGASALTDSKYANLRGDNKNWQGFEKEHAYFRIDLGEKTKISEISIRFFQHIGLTSVMLPTNLEIKVSDNGRYWDQIVSRPITVIENYDAQILTEMIKVNITARYIRFKATNRGILPEWHPRKNQNAWVFVDEVTVN